MNLIERNEIDAPPVDETTLTKYEKQLLLLREGSTDYENFDPEAVIFHKKQVLANSLLDIPVEDLSTAPEQSWYGEYIALMQIRLQNPALRVLGKKFVEELMNWYNERVEDNSRYLALAGAIQFVEPMELAVPFNQHLWHKTMIDDVRAVFTNYYPSTNYSDAEIARYYLSLQPQRKHEPRKIRVAFLVQSHITCDKVLPVYEAMKEREDIIPFLVIHAKANYDFGGNSWTYFHNRYPDDEIYDSCTLMDLERLHPDYVFVTNPYEERRPFPSFRVEDIAKFSKVCVISYGVSLIYALANRLFNEYTNFYQNVYMLFASTDSVKTVMEQKFPQNVAMNLLHIESVGYPALKTYYQLEREPSEAKRILWTPRWSYNSRIGGSHFMEYKDNFVALRKKYGKKVELFFRPHMNLFKNFVRNGILTKEDVAAYKKTLRKNGIARHTNLADFDKSIRNIDIFLADYSSILIELFLSGRPVIYCEFKTAVIFPEFEEMFAAMYIARSWEDVERYLEDLMADKDPLFEKRQEIAAKVFAKHAHATEKIIERIVRDFNAGSIQQ